MNDNSPSLGGFAKVYSLMLKSTVWDNPIETRMVWIVLLMLADSKGFVRCTPFSLSNDAGVSKESVLAALEVLSSPDPHSQNPEQEGRRILKAPGGWDIVSHGKYREYRTAVQVRDANYQARRRSRNHPELLSRSDMSDDTASASVFKKERTPKRVRRCPDSFEPNSAHIKSAGDRGLDIRLELAKFRDHEFQAPRSDWDACFRNWLRNAKPSGRHGVAAAPVRPRAKAGDR